MLLYKCAEIRMLVRSYICFNIGLLQKNAVGIWQVYRRRFFIANRTPHTSEKVQNGETFLFSGGVVTRVKSLVPDFITQLGTQVVAVCC